MILARESYRSSEHVVSMAGGATLSPFVLSDTFARGVGDLADGYL